MELFNTTSKKIEKFESIDKGRVRMYSCGPTVYSFQHIGNLRTYLFSDFLKRTLHFMGYRVLHAMNITDVGHLTDDADAGEDKVEKAAKAVGKDAWALTEFYKAKFFEDCATINILPPDIICRATNHIDEQINMVKRIEEKGLTYVTDDGVYFDTAKFTPITNLANMKIEASGAHSRVGTDTKRSSSDFSLWKFSPKGEKRQMEWESPWGVGFPGWHIECSAMSTTYLGDTFDIHTGGIDHIPIHHTNEIIQSEAATGKPFVNYWLHGGWLSMGDTEKMSKSKGGTLLLDHIMKRGIDPLAFRYLNLTAHYRSPLKFTWEALNAAATSLNRIKTFIAGTDVDEGNSSQEYLNRFKEALAADLDTPKAVSMIWILMKDTKVSDNDKARTMVDMDKVLGLRLLSQLSQEQTLEVPAQVIDMVNQRQLMKKEKQYDKADELRQQVMDAGFEIKDTKEGPSLRSSNQG